MIIDEMTAKHHDVKPNAVLGFLEHYGVKGMKWGVRKRDSGGSGSSAPAKPRAKDLTDDELRTAIARMELEKRYNDLSGVNKTPNKAVSNFIIGQGQTAAKLAVSSLVTQQVNGALKKATKTK